MRTLPQTTGLPGLSGSRVTVSHPQYEGPGIIIIVASRSYLVIADCRGLEHQPGVRAGTAVIVAREYCAVRAQHPQETNRTRLTSC